MSPPDCLIIHTPKFNDHHKLAGSIMSVNYMPMGLLGLADYLQKNGVACRILHQGVEWLNNPSGRLEDSLQSVDPRLIALSMHWHQQAYDVIETCKTIRALRPGAFLVLGGFTASFFHDELVRDYACIDAVLRGDAEIPLLQLARRLHEGKKDLGGVPNLTWRNSRGDVIQNPVTYCGTQEILDGTCFSNMDLLDNYRTYVSHVTFPFVFVKRLSKESNFKMVTCRRTLFPITLGRGCPMTCTWCAGSLDPQRQRISFRDKVLFRSHDAVIADIRRAMDYGYQAMYSVFDPTPQPQGQAHLIQLFKRIRQEGLANKLGWMHEATGLASRELVDEFAQTFSKDFRIIGVSPETGNEQVRRSNKGYYYSNQQLFDMLGYLHKKGVDINVFLTYGIPGENEATLPDTVKMRDEIVRRYGRRHYLAAHPIEIEPGAPWQMAPEKFGVVTSRRTFTDYYETHGESSKSKRASLGYYLPDYFNRPLDPTDPEGDFADRLQRFKCRHFCSVRPGARRIASPFWGRVFCRALRTIRFITRRDRPYETGRRPSP